MKPRRVIGLGSPFGDDQLGWQAVEALRGRLDGAELLTCDAPVRLLPLMEGARSVCLVDGVVSGAPPGTLHRFQGLPPGMPFRLSSHGVGLAEVLELGRALGIAPQLTFLGIEVASAGAMGPAVAEALPRLTAAIEAWCRTPKPAPW